MFLENPGKSNSLFGSIEVICGSMFSGKTEELIRRIKRAELANKNIRIFKPCIDKRNKENLIISHDLNEIKATCVNYAKEIIPLAQNSDIAAIDECQFFDDEIVNVANHLANNGIRVIISGLDMDFEGNPFGPMPALMAIAENVLKVRGICPKTGNLSLYSYRKSKEKNLILIGEKEIYQPMSREAFFKAMKKSKKK